MVVPEADVAEEPANTAAGPTPSTPAPSRSLPGWARWRETDAWSVAAVGVVVLAFGLTLRALFRFQGPPMEEGFMLVFPERVLHGALPNRDFLHLYGPGSLWALAAWFKVAGVSLASERVFGLAQLAGIVFGVMALVRPWGRRPAVAAGLVGVLVCTTAIGLTALAWNGAVALGVVGLWVALRARRWLTAVKRAGRAEAERRAHRLLLLSGLLAGLALLFRPDLVVGITLGFAAALWGIDRTRLTPWFGGLALGLAPYLVHLATAGPGHAVQGMLLDPVFHLRGGRSLPVPPSWNHLDGALQAVAQLRVPGWPLPAPAVSHQVVLWFLLLPLVVLVEVAVGVWRVRAAPNAWRPRVVLAVGLFGLGMMPQALQRPDTTHLAWVSCVPLAFLPAALAEAISNLGPRVVRRFAGATAAVLALLLPLVTIPYFTYRTWFDLTNQSRGHQIFGHGVHHAGRVFYLGSEPAAKAATKLTRDLDRLSTPGQRLFVGTADLRKTPYSDAYLYYLMPSLVPGTYYIEMDPGMANRAGSGLDRDLAGSDWAVLSRLWDVWREDNTSRELMSDAANQVLRRDFCKVKDYRERSADDPSGPAKVQFTLYRRCRASGRPVD
ncbi:MAG: hypothetical protein JWM05_703 [Acidimicrobiales bacterium]|nr:hypothetical protein [Acidimicrobiales bacterium]